MHAFQGFIRYIRIPEVEAPGIITECLIKQLLGIPNPALVLFDDTLLTCVLSSKIHAHHRVSVAV